MNYYPQPEVAFGLVNWGFKDRSGMSNISLGLAQVQGEESVFLAGKAPLGQSMFYLEGATYFQKHPLFTLGMKYRWKVGEKQ